MTAVSSLPIAVGVTKQSSTSTKTVFRIGGLSLCTGATVTYTASGGSTATTSVNIVTPDATSVTLSKSTLSLNVGSTYTLSATVSPSGASQSVTWSVYSGSAYASVSSTGKVTAKAAGTAVWLLLFW